MGVLYLCIFYNFGLWTHLELDWERQKKRGEREREKGENQGQRDRERERQKCILCSGLYELSSSFVFCVLLPGACYKGLS